MTADLGKDGDLVAAVHQIDLGKKYFCLKDLGTILHVGVVNRLGGIT